MCVYRTHTQRSIFLCCSDKDKPRTLFNGRGQLLLDGGQLLLDRGQLLLKDRPLFFMGRGQLKNMYLFNVYY
jgi:hypothetical protein